MDKKSIGYRIAQIAGLVIAAGVILGCIVVLYFAKTLPSVEQLSAQQISQSTRIYDRTGTILLYEIASGERRTVVAFDQIPQTLKDATVAIEDQNFYSEPAYDWRGIVRAIFVDIKTGSIAQGGSTITQQLARNAFLTLTQTPTRKLKELILAIKLNEYYSKDQILGMYLNEVPYGPNIAGVEKASEAYFGKTANELNLAQSALLAAIPQAPTFYSPWGSHVKDLLARQKLVLQKMYDLKKISKAQLDEALNYKIVIQPQSVGNIKAPHFVMAVENYLVQKYGEDMVNHGGLRVMTTLNWNLQQAGESAVASGVARNQQLYQSFNGALVAQDPKTGQILAMVGSRNYFATSSLPAGCTPSVNCKFDPNFNVAMQGLRQPGSSLKPFVYLTGFQKGWTPDSKMVDVPTEFSTDPSCPPLPNFKAAANPKCFHPQNFEGTFVGPISIRSSLAESVNIPAVQMLYLAGEKNVLKNAASFGFTTLTDPTKYGLSLVLGGGAVRLYDEVSAYSVLATEGIKHDQTMILQVQDPSGNVLESYQDQPTQVSDAQSIRLINSILSDPQARAPLFQGSQSLTVFPGHDVALKTGTSNDYHDAWAMGYTPSLVVGVWAGNNDNSAMKKNGSSILAAVPIWSAFLNKVLGEMPNETFNKPDPVSPSNMVVAGSYPIENPIHSILHYVDKNNPNGPSPVNPASDSQYKNWELAIQSWASTNLMLPATMPVITTPSTTQPVATTTKP